MINNGKVRRNNNKDARYGKFYSYERMKLTIAKYRFKSRDEYQAYVRHKHSVGQWEWAPVHPTRTYKFEWENWRVFLGESFFCSYEHAKMLAKKHNIWSQAMWEREYEKIAPLPYKLPKLPARYYKEHGDRWEGAAEFFAGRPAAVIKAHREACANGTREHYLKKFPMNKRWDKKKRVYRPYVEASKLMASLEIRDWEHYRQWRSKYRGDDMPWRPWETYKADWEGWAEFLGHKPGIAYTYEVAVLYIVHQPGNASNVFSIGVDRLGASNVSYNSRIQELNILRLWKMDWELQDQVNAILNAHAKPWADGKLIVTDGMDMVTKLGRILEPVAIPEVSK